MILDLSEPGAVAALTGIDVVFVPDRGTWGEALTDLRGERKRFDLLLGLTPTAERAKEMAFTDTYLQEQSAIIARAGAEGIGGIADLAGRSVAVERRKLERRSWRPGSTDTAFR